MRAVVLGLVLVSLLGCSAQVVAQAVCEPGAPVQPRLEVALERASGDVPWRVSGLGVFAFASCPGAVPLEDPAEPVEVRFGGVHPAGWRVTVEPAAWSPAFADASNYERVESRVVFRDEVSLSVHVTRVEGAAAAGAPEGVLPLSGEALVFAESSSSGTFARGVAAAPVGELSAEEAFLGVPGVPAAWVAVLLGVTAVGVRRSRRGSCASG